MNCSVENHNRCTTTVQYCTRRTPKLRFLAGFVFMISINYQSRLQCALKTHAVRAFNRGIHTVNLAPPPKTPVSVRSPTMHTVNKTAVCAYHIIIETKILSLKPIFIACIHPTQSTDRQMRSLRSEMPLAKTHIPKLK